MPKSKRNKLGALLLTKHACRPTLLLCMTCTVDRPEHELVESPLTRPRRPRTCSLSIADSCATVTLSKTKRKSREWRGGLISTVRQLLEECAQAVSLRYSSDTLRHALGVHLTWANRVQVPLCVPLQVSEHAERQVQGAEGTGSGEQQVRIPDAHPPKSLTKPSAVDPKDVRH